MTVSGTAVRQYCSTCGTRVQACVAKFIGESCTCKVACVRDDLLARP